MDDFESDRCPVCHEKIGKADEISSTHVDEHLKDLIWKPGDPIPEVIQSISEHRREIERHLAESRNGN